MNMRITKAPAGGSVRAIPSKSMAHRLIIAGALSKEENRILINGSSEDIEATKECMQKIQKAYASSFPVSLNVRESGATLRFLVPVAAALGLTAEFYMEGRLPERPMGQLLEQLRQHGVEWRQTERNILSIKGQLQGGIFELPGNQSSQFVTGLLMALPLIGQNSEVRVLGELESRPYVDMTLDVLKKSGITIFEDEPGRFIVPGGQEYLLKGEHDAGGDWSSAAFWLAAGAASARGNGITVQGLDPESQHGDKMIVNILEEMGAEIGRTGNDLTTRPHSLRSLIIDVRNTPDLVPAIAVAACKASGKTVIMNAERLRLKESDRLHAITEVLKCLGAMVNERPDGLEIFGGYMLHGGRVSSFNDHRIAMMAACLRGQTPEGPEGDIIIEGTEAVNKSYPGFWEDYRLLGGKTEEIYMKILVINGPNLNMLGIREPELYGKGTLADLEDMITRRCKELGVKVSFFQSNHEGAIVDAIQKALWNEDGIIINAAGYTHTSVAILDALKAVGLPTAEVHLTDINEREEFRKFSYVSLYALKTIVGKGFDGYIEAVDFLADYDRVKRMEAAMDRVAEALKSGSKYKEFRSDVAALEKYYAKEWRSDFEKDEEGYFPEGMKRGVLSEDGLYNLLGDVK